MTGAMYAAIGGLKSHMSKLNVIGNNIANVNTYGYKAQRMTFKESMYTTSRSGSNGGVTSGGNNPSQIGYGCSVGSIDLNMSPSTYAPTGVGLDCYIDGEGFFMVGDKVNYANGETGITKASEVSKLDLTRVGDFWVDPDGYVCNRDGKVLFGFARVQNPAYDPEAKDPGENATPEQKAEYDLAKQETIISTELVPLRVPLSAAAPTEANGGQEKDANDKVTNLWDEGDPVYPYLSGVTDGKGGTNKYADPAQNGEKHPIKDGSRFPVAKNENADRVSDVLPLQLKNMSIGKNGAIQGTAPNGQTVVFGYVAIASADSPDGVTHIDGPYYKAMGGAGNIRVSALGIELPHAYLGNLDPGAEGTTAADAILIEKDTELRDGGLEASSTDIATEFTEMITTQRGYQANTRIITVTDSMLEELVNMKR